MADVLTGMGEPEREGGIISLSSPLRDIMTPSCDGCLMWSLIISPHPLTLSDLKLLSSLGQATTDHPLTNCRFYETFTLNN